MMLFDDNVHLHTGYYVDAYDIEGVFLKVYEQNIWCLFYNDDAYTIKILHKSAYPFIHDFGYLVRIYHTTESELTQRQGDQYFKHFIQSSECINDNQK